MVFRLRIPFSSQAQITLAQNFYGSELSRINRYLCSFPSSIWKSGHEAIVLNEIYYIQHIIDVTEEEATYIKLTFNVIIEDYTEHQEEFQRKEYQEWSQRHS